MRGGVDGLQGFDRYLRIDFGGAEFLVSKHGLDEAHVGAVLQHQRRHRVSKDMAGALLVDARFLDGRARDLGDAVGLISLDTRWRR